YSAKGLPQHPRSNHKGKPYQSCQCSCLTMFDIKTFHKNFYEIKRKDIQDSFILKHSEALVPKRHKYEPLKKARSVKQSKLNDVKELLNKHFGSDWKNFPHLQFYKNTVYDHNNSTIEETGDDPACEPSEVVKDLRV
ncbi:hypothetical protein J6590_107840, partial [Homalodisca vitripennis]